MRVQLAAAAVLTLLAVGCFGPDGASDSAKDAGSDAAFGAGGFGGFAGSVGNVGGGDPVEQPPGKPIVCGDVECPVVGTAAMLGIESCCSVTQRCSLTMGGNPCEDLADPDPRCGTIPVGTGELPGCCGADGMCGANVEMLGFGCVPVDVLASIGVMALSRPCIDAGALDDDAGVESAETP